MNLIQEVLFGITKKLSVFDAEVYIDEVKSNIETPSFIVKLVTHTHVRYPGNRFYKRMPFQIAYIPSTDENCSLEIYDVLSKLNYLLEVIELRTGDLMRGYMISHEVVDNVLYFNITYQAHTHIKQEEEFMDTLNTNLGVD